MADDCDELTAQLESVDEIAIRHLKSWARFPKDKDIFEAREDIEVTYLTPWLASFTGGNDCILHKGTKIKVRVDETEKYPISIHAVIFDNEIFEEKFIPEEIRTNENYRGLILTISTEALNQYFRLLSH